MKVEIMESRDRTWICVFKLDLWDIYWLLFFLLVSLIFADFSVNEFNFQL
jgi:hypothetical protein